MEAIFGGGNTQSAPPPPAPPPSIDSGDVSRAAAEERKRRSLAQGRGSTQLTSVEAQTEEPTLARKKLLGS